ncbi:MAG: tRNA pseudouridine(38-40) synthase TruA [Roseitalea porphyridii]|jgi:tRNA pseudouridine38-40 synthase|uniref:tRNA pseudouridine(38-40) synthase TruA n=1 Tax=Roseitalea porphyridii TaxID=1852022 RepID=UPI0032EDBCD3
MPRYRLTIEYDGTPYVGWQRQKNGHAVQEAVEKAIFEFSKQTVTLQVAGRTDTGVHAIAQTAHVDLDRDWDPVRVREAINAYLVLDEERIAVVAAEKVGEDFHARFSAQTRHYLYRIHNRPAPLTLDHRRAWWCKRHLDIDAMNDAARVLIGTHDFTTFRAAQCQSKSPVKTLDAITFSRDGEFVTAHVSARSFLHNQVRSLVGTLKLVGEGRWTKDDVRRVLEARDHQKCGALAPPHGLYLLRVDYPETPAPGAT